MQKTLIVVKTSDGGFIEGDVEFSLRDITGTSSISFKGVKGVARLELPYHFSRIDTIAVRPQYGYWSVTTDETLEEIQIECRPVEAKCRGRFKNLINAGGKSRGTGVRIGVIDAGYFPVPGLEHVAYFDCRGAELTNLDLSGSKDDMHGASVLSILTCRSRHEFRCGIAPDATVYAVQMPYGDENELDPQAFLGAVENLVSMGVDLINVSAGMVLDRRFSHLSKSAISAYRSIFQQAEQIAKSQDVLIIAASGNDSSFPVHYPANLTGVLGVGGLGICDLAPEGTDQHKDQMLAHETRPTVKLHNQELFSDPHFSYRGKLDVLGISSGIVWGFDDDNLSEYWGTSYAAPMVTGALACYLSDKIIDGREPKSYTMRSKHKLARSLAWRLALPRKVQGSGFVSLAKY